MFSKAFRSFSVGKQIAFLALFIALAVAVNSFELNLGFAKITFSYFVCFFAGALLGPLPGFAVGLLGDAIGFLIVPQGVYWFFGVTLGLFGFLSGLFVNKLHIAGRRGVYLKAAIALAVCFVAITCVVNSLVNFYYLKMFVDGYSNTFGAYFAGRMATQAIVYAVNVALCFLVLPGILRIRAFARSLINVRREEGAKAPLPQYEGAPNGRA